MWGWAVTGSPQPPQAERPPPCWELLASGTPRAPGRCTPPPGHRLHIQTHSGTHPETHKDSHWLVARHPRPRMRALCVPDARSHTIGAHTHSIPGTHTLTVTHSFQGGGNAGHPGRHSLPWVFTATPGPHPGTQVGPQELILLPWRTYTARSSLQAPCGAPPEGSGSRILGALAESPACPRLLDR